MECSNCIEFGEEILVRTPKELSSIIGQVKSAISNGTLKEQESKEEYSEPFKLIDIEQGWPDIILNYFSCTSCNQQFKLFANTYHGSSKNGWYIL